MEPSYAAVSMRTFGGERDREDQGRRSSQELDKASSMLGIVNHLALDHQAWSAHNTGLGTMLATLPRFCIEKKGSKG